MNSGYVINHQQNKTKTKKQTKTQLTVVVSGTWSVLLGSQSKNNYIEIPVTVALVIKLLSSALWVLTEVL